MVIVCASLSPNFAIATATIHKSRIKASGVRQKETRVDLVPQSIVCV